ncbi:hypothetical protein F4824DRAFT_71489 [Ustulina deusta]|nr:hypothetical protein F4823DRAFT_147091 [Ustulina deusta]KAI3338608.1 hypothetical protein F4824DRAFT_71489 [Ustulina deusta]
MDTPIANGNPHRFFDPSLDPQCAGARVDVVSNHFLGVSHMALKDPLTKAVRVDRSSVVVRICTSWGNIGTDTQPIIRTGWGVYAGPRSSYNASGIMSADEVQTIHRAEAQAFENAINFVLHMHMQNLGLRRFTIMLRSDYLVNAITRDGMDSSGKPVVHPKPLETAFSWFNLLEQAGISIRLWSANWDMLRSARLLASKALLNQSERQ